jgi:hypothetical protein
MKRPAASCGVSPAWSQVRGKPRGLNRCVFDQALLVKFSGFGIQRVALLGKFSVLCEVFAVPDMLVEGFEAAVERHELFAHLLPLAATIGDLPAQVLYGRDIVPLLCAARVKISRRYLGYPSRF